LIEVILVVSLRGVELLQRDDLRHDRIFEFLLRHSFRLLRRRFLRIAFIKDDRAILRAGIVTLPVQCRRIVRGKEDLHQFVEAQRVRIEGDFDDLSVAGIALADLFVRRIRHAATGVSRDDRFHAFQALEDGLEAPKASASERDVFAS